MPVVKTNAFSIPLISSCAIHGIVISLASVIIHHRHLQFALDGAVGRSLRSVGPKIQVTFGLTWLLFARLLAL